MNRLLTWIVGAVIAVPLLYVLYLFVQVVFLGAGRPPG